MKDNDEAVFWAIRRDSGSLSVDDETRLLCWLDADPRRQGSLLRAEAMLSYLDRARALNHPPSVPDEGSRWLDGLNRRQVVVGTFLSVSLALGAGTLSLWSGREKLYATALGEIRNVPLSDGSLATINTSSRIAVDMAAGQRLIKLEEGEAWFRVAHNANRPFIVQVGSIRVKALGTAFSVRRRNGLADVLVTEGVVQAWNDRGEGNVTLLKAGFRASLSQTSSAVNVAEAGPAIERALAWRNGEIALGGETLGEAVAEFNRYNERKLIVSDQGLARTPLVGYFEAKQPQDFAIAVASIVHAQIDETRDAIIITRKKA